jgi:pyruvate formate lyase activating enzyme
MVDGTWWLADYIANETGNLRSSMATGTIFDLRRFCIHDGPGIRTTVFLKGCPLDCWWCHNPEGRTASANGGVELQHSEAVGQVVDSADVISELLRDRPFYEQSGGGVTFSGGEPMFQIEFLRTLLSTAKAHQLHTVVDTCGYAPVEDFRKIRPLVDLFLYDLKLIDNDAHITYTGVSNELILQNLEELAGSGSRLLIRIPLIPGVTDTDQNLKGIARFLKTVPGITRVNLLPYNKLGEDKARRFGLTSRLDVLTPQTEAQLSAASRIFRSEGYETRVRG